MKRDIIHSIAFIILVASATAFFLAGKGRTPLPGAVAQASPREGLLVAAPGRVEPVCKEGRVISEVAGRLQGIFIEEGDGVERGLIGGKSNLSTDEVSEKNRSRVRVETLPGYLLGRRRSL